MLCSERTYHAQVSSNYTSDVLYHFVGAQSPSDHARNYETLRSILGESIIAKPPHDGTWGPEVLHIDTTRSLLDEELVVPRMVCVADIPKACLEIHCSKYGRFGMGFRREFLVRYGFRPVMYFPYSHDDYLGAYGRTRLGWIEQAFKDCYAAHKAAVPAAPIKRIAGRPSASDEEVLEAASTALLRDLLPFLKPYDADLPENDPRCYYLEREWRRLGNLKFEARDVACVFVEASYLARARSEFPEVAPAIIACPVP